MEFSLILPYFRNPTMLQIQLDEWRKHKYCDLIIVDDCSGVNPAKDVISPENGLSLYEITTDKKWNQHGARNLGAMVCSTEAAMFTDMDHLLRAEDAEKLSKEAPDPDCVLTFSRVTAPDLTPYKPHPNSFLVHSEKYWSVNGYDEDFTGSYGGDGVFMRQLGEICGFAMRHDIALVRYPREHVPDASTTDFDREKDKKEYRKIFDRKRAEGDLISKNPIRFEWTRIY